MFTLKYQQNKCKATNLVVRFYCKKWTATFHHNLNVKCAKFHQDQNKTVDLLIIDICFFRIIILYFRWNLFCMFVLYTNQQIYLDHNGIWYICSSKHKNGWYPLFTPQFYSLSVANIWILYLKKRKLQLFVYFWVTRVEEKKTLKFKYINFYDNNKNVKKPDLHHNISKPL